jgi:FMN phosphatase YigB (HAD superfamily)
MATEAAASHGVRRQKLMVKAIIFDLDNCLSRADEVGRQFLEPMFAALRRTNKGCVPENRLQEAFDAFWSNAYDWVAREYGFSDEMCEAGWAAASKVEIDAPMHGYPDIAELANLPAKLFLVTSGFRRLQESKIKALGFRSRFVEVHVDDIEEADRKGKEGIFQDILQRHGFSPREVLVVGDNPESEIKAGNNLGIPTVQILRQGVRRGTNATHYIHTLLELRALLPNPNEEK